MARTVIIGCKLPHGLLITDPLDKKRKVRILGLRDTKVIGSTFATTPVDGDLWDIWKASYADYAPLKSGAIFEASNQPDADAKGNELAGEKTGLEPLDPKAHGVKAADKEDDDRE